MKIHPLFPGLFAAALLALPACADDPEPAAAPAAPEAPEAAPAEAPEDPDAPLYRLFEELDALFMDGQTNAVSKRLKAAVADPVFKPRADRLFSIFLGFLLQTGQIHDVTVLRQRVGRLVGDGRPFRTSHANVCHCYSSLNLI